MDVLRVLMIDDGLKDWSGHNAAYALSVLDELCRRGIQCELFANRNISQLDTTRVNVVPAFRNFAAGISLQWRSLPAAINRAARFLYANWSHLLDLFAAVNPYVRRQDVILVLIASSRTTLAYALWFLWLSILRRRLTILFVIHNRPHALFKWEARFLQAAASGHTIIWAAHTTPVQNMCTDALGRQSLLLPLPLGADCTVRPPSRPPDSTIVFSYLGVALVPKGLDILVNAIEGVSDLLRAEKLALVVQCNIHREDQQLEELYQELAALARNIPGIEIIAGPLTPTEYHRRMNDSDLVLIPHRRQFFRFALSGVFTEALSAGKPVVVASDTYMAEELRRFGAGICFEDGNSVALAQAMRAAVDDIEGLRRRAFEAQSVWRGVHNAERYVSELCTVVDHS